MINYNDKEEIMINNYMLENSKIHK